MRGGMASGDPMMLATGLVALALGAALLIYPPDMDINGHVSKFVSSRWNRAGSRVLNGSSLPN